MSDPVPRRPMTDMEQEAVKCLQQVTYPVASWDKRFAHSLYGMKTITDKEVPQVWSLFKRYRRQIRHPDKAALLDAAEKLAAPDFRKISAKLRRMHEERQKYEAAMKTTLV